MRINTLAIAFMLASTSLPALAATTPDDAAKLKATLQNYLGKGSDAVKVEPDGDGYKATVDLSAMVKGLKSNGADFSMTPLEYKFKPIGGGKWSFHTESPIKFSFKDKDQVSVEETVNKINIDGEYDEALATLTSMKGTFDDITLKEHIVDPQGLQIDIAGTGGGVTFDMTGTAAAGGGVDFKIKETLGALKFSEDTAQKGEQPLHLDFNIAGGTFGGTIGGAKTVAFSQLLAFLNAHQDKAAIGKDQAAFKTILKGFMPVFGNMDASGDFNTVKVTSPFGEFGLNKVGIGIVASGATKDGKFGESFSVEGLTLPAALVPPWAVSLIPKGQKLSFTVSGYDLASAAEAWLAAADFTKEPPVPKEQEDKLLGLLLPKGSVAVGLSNTSISNDMYNLSAEGSMDVGPAAQPSGKAHIMLKGLDDIVKALHGAPPEMGTGQVDAVAVVAKGLAKAESDGSLTWDVSATADGKIMVNGTDVSKMGK